MYILNKPRLIIVLCSLFLLLLYVARSLSAVALFLISALSLFLFNYIDRTYKYHFPRRYYLYIFTIVGLGPLIGAGEAPFGLFYRSIVYDKFLHSFLPLLLCIIIFYMIDKNFNINLKWKLLMTAFMVFGILGIFEIGEYISDKYFDTIFQGVYSNIIKSKANVIQNPLDDTMRDLIAGVLGSLIFVIYKGFRDPNRGKIHIIQTKDFN